MEFETNRLPSAINPLDAELAGRLSQFVDLTRGLTQSPLFKQPQLAVHFEPEPDGRFTPSLVAPVDELGTRGTLTWFRQLWQDGEPAHFPTLRGRLREHALASNRPDSGDFVAWLDALGNAYSDVRRQLPDFAVMEAEVAPAGEVLRDESVRAERVIDDWVNGVVFHSDPEKRARIDLAGAAEMYAFALLAAIQEVTKVYVQFARMGKAILSEPKLAPR